MFRNKLIISISLLVLFVLIFLNLMLGSIETSFTDTWNALRNVGDSMHITIVNQIRLPRVIAGIAVGSTLSLSGLLTRVIFKNPLADSGVLGIQSGASFFVVLIMLVVPSMYVLLPIAAFIGGIIAFVLVISLSMSKRKIDTTKMILSGIAVNSFFTGLISIIHVLNKDKIQFTVSYLGGSIANISRNTSDIMMFYAVLAIVLGLLSLPIIKILRLDDQMISNLGKNPTYLRILASLIAVLLASVSVTFIGVIGFIGIIIPYFAFMIIRNINIYYYIETMILGAILVLGADLFQRLAFDPMEIPVGTIIGLIGTPLFLLFIKKEWKSKEV